MQEQMNFVGENTSASQNEDSKNTDLEESAPNFSDDNLLNMSEIDAESTA